MSNPQKRRTRELLAVAWEMEGALAMPFVVRENGDVALDPDALDEWWSKHREAVMAAYDEHHPRQNTDVRCSECGQPASTPTAHQGSASGHGTWWECPRQFTEDVAHD